MRDTNACLLNLQITQEGAVDFLEGREALQGDLNKLLSWAITTQMKFSENKCQILHVEWCSFGYMYGLGHERLENSLVGGDLGVLV